MQFFNYFLLIYFINLCNTFTFTLINKKNFLLRNYKHKLNMGCDYYIDKDLHVYDYNDRIISYIELDHKESYYYFTSLFDMSEYGYDKELNQYIKYTLEPLMQPIIIYSNNTFNTLTLKNKYKKIINYELDLLNKTWDDVNKIIEIEHRYKRE